MEQLNKAEKNNLATQLVFVAKKMPYMLEINREMARKLDIIEEFEFLEKRFDVEMPIIEQAFQASKKNEN